MTQTDPDADRETPVQRWGLYARREPVRMWAVTLPSKAHPSWWPYVWIPMRDELYRTDIWWDHEPTAAEVGSAIESWG